jgi:DNA-binding IclR family transcriptional regulator
MPFHDDERDVSSMIGSILKALDILALFNSAEPRLSLAVISERLGLPKSTVHNLLQTLMSRGLIEQVQNSEYAVGVELIVLSQAARVNVELRDRAAPLLRELADSCDESVYLTVRQGDSVLYIYAIESRHRLMARSAVGERVPLHCTSNGKSILAQLPSDDLAAFARRTGLPRFTKDTITTLPALSKEMAVTRARGFAVDQQEHEPHTYCLGVAIFDANNRTLGACSIAGRDPEIIGARRALLADHLKYTAQQISRRMGYVPAVPSQVNRLDEKDRVVA